MENTIINNLVDNIDNNSNNREVGEMSDTIYESLMDNADSNPNVYLAAWTGANGDVNFGDLDNLAEAMVDDDWAFCQAPDEAEDWLHDIHERHGLLDLDGTAEALDPARWAWAWRNIVDDQGLLIRTEYVAVLQNA